MIVTRYLWENLLYPTRHHPLFWAVNRVRPRPAETPAFRELSWTIFLMGLAILLFFTMPMLMIVGLLALTLFVPILMVILNGTAFGLFWAIETCRAVCGLGRRLTWDLLETSPLSAYGSAWITAAGRIHRGKLFQQAYQIMFGLTGTTQLALGGMVAILLMNSLNSSPQYAENYRHTAGEVVRTMGILLGLWFDHVQSILLGCLCGILVARFSSDTLVRIINAGLLYMVLKGSILLTIAIVYALVDFAIGRVSSTLWFNVIIGFAFPLIYFLVHEAVLGVLWRVVIWKYGS